MLELVRMMNDIRPLSGLTRFGGCPATGRCLSIPGATCSEVDNAGCGQAFIYMVSNKSTSGAPRPILEVQELISCCPSPVRSSQTFVLYGQMPSDDLT
jgi:hypothetical protein